jgi:rubredoxin
MTQQPPKGMEDGFATDERRSAPDAKLECKICWWVYDPNVGDPEAGVPPGRPFCALPDHWRCPQCDAEPAQFLVVS